MHSALTLAARGLGRTAPNPTVGCIILDKFGATVGRGVTHPGGRPHAETVALAQAGDRARGGTAFVTLEPCAHTGQTGPCAQALISAGVARVVSAIEDPDPRVQGRGHSLLRDAGIEVTVGVMATAARTLNAGFLSCVLRGKPLVTLKVATSSDGKMALANGVSQWITGPLARDVGHLLRGTHDAILTGIGTVLSDDPQLSCRISGMADRSPFRCLVDMRGDLPRDAKVLASPPSGRVLVYTGPDGAVSLQDHANVSSIVCQQTARGHADLSDVLRDLSSRGVTRLLVEAGPGLTTAFLRQRLVDRLIWFRSSSILGGDSASAVRDLELKTLTSGPHFSRVSVSQLGPDLMETYVTSA